MQIILEGDQAFKPVVMKSSFGACYEIVFICLA